MRQRRKLLKLLITGGRTFCDVHYATKVLKFYQRKAKAIGATLVVTQGGAQGADTVFRDLCKKFGVPCLTVDAQWEYYRNSAGPIRNGWMLEFIDQTHGFVFPGDTGTADCANKMAEYGLEVLTYQEFDELPLGG